MRAWLSHVAAFLFILAAVFVGCAEEQAPPALLGQIDASAPVDKTPAVDAQADPPSGNCWQARAEALPARLVAMQAAPDGGADADAGPMETTFEVGDLFQLFSKGICGGCHFTQAQGGFQITSAGDFQTKMTPSALARIMSENACDAPVEPMPPCNSGGRPFSQRPTTDPVYRFAKLVKIWLDDGSPSSFMAVDPAAAADNGAGASQTAAVTFALPPSMGNAMTNLGTCVPTRGIVAYEQTKSVALDKMFAEAVADPSSTVYEKQLGLPLHLKDTDLFTLDSKTLAAYGVVAYAPGYPLWSDNAGKLRYVRVPRGQSIHFDKATQEFDIPPNTRFYKTFLKSIVDKDGSYRWRKIETRIIVSRPNTLNSDGTNQTHALFGSYKWTDDEQDAVLITALDAPLNNGQPFGDTVLPYATDEQLEAAVLASDPAYPNETLVQKGALRHYAIPSAQRCIDCHRGSASESFVLGFLPLQIMRRPVGQGGVIEASGPDELTQLQRLIDYGVITGVDSPDDIVPLERSEGSRAPRNDYELVAQGYMLGNCSHCHNPNGLATQQNPILKDVLNFLPAPDSGIFQFPLEKYSPRIFRGLSGVEQIPYITPSLLDLPIQDVDGSGMPTLDANPFFISPGVGNDNRVHVQGAFYAPWRSLIYRNVDNPFPYTYDHVFFPHMPMNTPGYDPRAKQIVSDWMVSIPAVRKNPQLSEYAFKGDGVFNDGNDEHEYDTAEQPYVEVMPGEPAYDGAVAAANARLAILHGADNPAIIDDGHLAIVRYSDPGNTGDIFDPETLLNPRCDSPAPATGGNAPHTVAPQSIPGHCHWVVTDTTLPPGDWGPRRPDWQVALIQSVVPADGSCVNQGDAGTGSVQALCADQMGAAADALNADRQEAVNLLQKVRLDDAFRTFATTRVPFGLWKKKAGCLYPNQPSVSAVPHEPWMDIATGWAPADPVYMQAPGEAVFNTICVNCHGPKGDGTGRMAQNLVTLTGGSARVADFRDGLFGPLQAPLSALATQFGTLTPASKTSCAASDWLGVTAEERAARYMAWMGLGGTTVRIPPAILDVVGTTRILGQARVVPAFTPSANMLSLAKSLCHEVLAPSVAGRTFNAPSLGITGSGGYLASNLFRSLIASNGDAQLWLDLCSINNPPPVRLLSAGGQATPLPLIGPIVAGQSAGLIRHEAYPQGKPVGNDRGTVDPALSDDPLTDTNRWPWCVDASNPESKAAAATDIARGAPICPDGLYSTENLFTNDDLEQWTVRGAINAGLAVFLYLEGLEGHDPQPTYDACEQLSP
jgi:cytochrome c553